MDLRNSCGTKHAQGNYWPKSCVCFHCPSLRSIAIHFIAVNVNIISHLRKLVVPVNANSPWRNRQQCKSIVMFNPHRNTKPNSYTIILIRHAVGFCLRTLRTVKMNGTAGWRLFYSRVIVCSSQTRKNRRKQMCVVELLSLWVWVWDWVLGHSPRTSIDTKRAWQQKDSRRICRAILHFWESEGLSRVVPVCLLIIMLSRTHTHQPASLFLLSLSCSNTRTWKASQQIVTDDTQSSVLFSLRFPPTWRILRLSH